MAEVPAIMCSYNRRVAHAAKKERMLGTVCCNCGKECQGEIEYHHIVPLERGGKDVISNLAPVCYDCHTKIHFEFGRRKPERTGRKRKVYDQALMDRVFGMYVNGEMMEVDARKELGTGCRIRDMVQFKEWAESKGIDLEHAHFGRGGPQHK